MKLKPIKTIYLVLGTILATAIACYALYFFTVKYPSYKDSAINFSQSGVSMRTRSGGRFEKLSKSTGDSSAEYAFGLKIGGFFDVNNAIKKLYLSSGGDLYEILPSNPNGDLNKYYVTLEKDKIKTVRGVKSFDSKGDADLAVMRLNNAMNSKYSKVSSKDDFYCYKDVQGNMILVFIKTLINKHEVHVHYIRSHQSI